MRIRLDIESLSTRIILIVVAILAASAAVSLYFQGIAIKNSLLKEEIARARELTWFCEENQQFISYLRYLEVFDDTALVARLQEELAQGKRYDETKIYLTIPVVAAWTAAEANAEALGYRFRVPKNHARDPKNEPRPGVEKAVVDYLEGKGSIAGIERTGAKILFPKDKEKAREQGEIGISYNGIEKGNAFEGSEVRQTDALIFFKAVKLTPDCLSCHGDPAGSLDILGFPKEGWKAGDVHGAFKIGIPLAPMRHELASARWKSILISLLLLVAAGFILYGFVRKMIQRPLTKISEFVQQIGRGDFSGQIRVETKDEIGQMAFQLNVSVKSIGNIIKRLSDIAGTLNYSSDELTGVSNQLAASSEELSAQSSTVASATEEISSGITTVAASAEQASTGVETIAGMAEEMSSTAREIAQLSQRTSGKVKSMADSSSQMSGVIQNVAAAVEEMTASLHSVAQSTDHSSRISEKARENALGIDGKMNTLSEASKEIRKIVGVIKDIADQTNLLALNATIEAAGAGEAGKGFAVVAGEVKLLARQSGEASGEIAERIENIRNLVKDVVVSVSEIGQVIGQSASINQEIAASVGEQTAAASEISREVANGSVMARSVSDLSSEAWQLVADIAEITRQSSEGAREVAQNAAQVSGAAKEVSRASEEASVGSNEIARNVEGVSTAAREIAANAAITNQSATDLSRVSHRLAETVRSFHVGSEKFDISSVKSAHLNWRSRLEGLLHGVSALTSAEVTSDRNCDFGKWYFGSEGQRFKEDPLFKTIGRHHHDVHEYARKIVKLNEEKRYDQARSLMEDFEESRRKMFDALEGFYLQ